MKKLLVFLAVLALSFGQVEAATIYVDGDLAADCLAGNYSVANRSCTGTDGNARTTIQGAANVVVAGDIVQIRKKSVGDYSNFTSTAAGTSAQRITYRNHPTESPVISEAINDNAPYPITIGPSAHFVTVDGLTTSGGSFGIHVTSSNNVELRNLVVKNAAVTGMYIQTSPNLIVEDSTIQDNSQRNSTGAAAFWGGGIYVLAGSTSAIIRRNRIFNNFGEGFTFGLNTDNGIASQNEVFDNFSANMYVNDAKNVTLEKNLVYLTNAWKARGGFFDASCLICVSSGDDPGIGGPVAPENITIKENVLINGGIGTPAIFVWNAPGIPFTFQNSKIVKNTIFSSDGGIVSSGGVTFSNNLVQDNLVEEVTGSGFIASIPTAGAGNTLSNNRYNDASGSAALLFHWAGVDRNFAGWVTASGETASTFGTTGMINPNIDPSIGNYALLDTSACINAGAVVTGVPFNGANPDCGGHESSTAISGTTVNTSNVDISLGSAFAPFLPTSPTIANWTLKKNGVAQTISAITRPGNATYRIACSACLAAGDTILASYSGTEITDQTLIGNLKNQRLSVFTDFAVTNTLAGGGAVLSVEGFRIRDWAKNTVTNTAQDWLAAENVVGKARNDGAKIAIDVVVACNTGNCNAEAFRYETNTDGGAYANMGNAFGANNMRYDNTQSLATHGTQTICPMILTNPELTCIVGAVTAQDGSYPVIDLSQDSATNIQGMFSVKSGLPNGTRICVRVKPDSATSITHNVTACFDIVNPAAGQAG